MQILKIRISLNDGLGANYVLPSELKTKPRQGEHFTSKLLADHDSPFVGRPTLLEGRIQSVILTDYSAKEMSDKMIFGSADARLSFGVQRFVGQSTPTPIAFSHDQSAPVASETILTSSPVL